MPARVVFQSDNAASEMKNQTVAKMGAFLTHKVFPEGASHVTAEKGHTHNELDRRFGVVATACNRADVLQTPEAFIQRIHDTVTPQSGMEVLAQRLPAVFDWSSFFDNLGVKMMGHAGAGSQHVWRFVHRSSCAAVPISPTVGSPRDIIFLAKDYMRSRSLSQAPFVFAQASQMEALNFVLPIALAQRHILSERVLQDYRKAAQVVAEKPWHMLDAQNYLETLARDNEQRKQWPAPVLHVVWKGPSRTIPLDHSMEVNWADFAPNQMKGIEVRSISTTSKATAAKSKTTQHTLPKRTAKTKTRQNVAEAVVPDAAVPDAAVPDAAVLDAAVPAAAVPDAAVPDARTADWTLDTIPDGLPADVDLSLGCSKCKDSSCRHCRWRRIKRMADALGYPHPYHLKNTACSKRQRIQKRPAAAPAAT